ncbi:hypothetical protein [Clostridium sp.]|uniref:hypothetical protein n=1 Tax=Clostridium sp. TaxID=1506 RepID=UPI001D71FFC1|nr:hypothetical protein [Clostridium sp.]MBS5937183.1 hypothetical protein [Clostridium sp.]
MIEVKIRDLKKKGRSLRSEGIITGTLKRKDGRIFNIEMNGNNLDTLVNRDGLSLSLSISFEREVINTKITRVQRDVLHHNIINVDLLEK